MKKFFILLLISILFVGCSNKKETVSQSSFLLNTVASIKIYDTEKEFANTIISQGFSVAREYENILSKTIETSDIYKINESKGEWISVDNSTLEVLELSIQYSKLSDGKFDPTIATITELWDFQSETPTIPEEKYIFEHLNYVDYNSIEIKGNEVRLLDSNASIDLGGVAKGYIADKVREFLVEKGIEKAIIDLGGNIVTINTDENEPFNIGIQKPFDQQGNLFGVLEISNMSVVTSGTYQRFFEVDGRTYHHILDTKTGYPIENGLFSTTVICSNSAVADVLSTTCFVLGIEEGLKLIEETPNTEIIFIKDDFTTIYSSGIDDSVKFNLID